MYDVVFGCCCEGVFVKCFWYVVYCGNVIFICVCNFDGCFVEVGIENLNVVVWCFLV